MKLILLLFTLPLLAQDPPLLVIDGGSVTYCVNDFKFVQGARLRIELTTQPCAPLIPPTSKVAPLVFSPTGGRFSQSVAVTISTATPGTAIHYTLDGGTPLLTSPLYSGPITLTTTGWLRASASKIGMESAGLEMLYTITPGPAPIPVARTDAIIVVNDATPAEAGTGGLGASLFVANYYALKRGIPTSNIVHVKTNTPADMGPAAWDSFHVSMPDYLARIQGPIKAFLEAYGKTRIKYIVPTYGVPSHFFEDDNSVDAWLAGMYAPGLPNINPLSNVNFAGHWQQEDLAYPIYAVSRLDGPSPAIAVGLVDKALEAERGISRKSGTGYYDWRHLAPAPDAYFTVDETVRRGFQGCFEAGFTCLLNDQTATGHMIQAAPSTLWAWGWYSGPTVNDVYSFVPGAVGAQMTSYTAGRIRSPAPGAWVPLWLSQGITATWGTTAEPSASLYAWGDRLLDWLWKGYTFGEAGILSQDRLGWMMVFVGDPLYSPKFID